MSSFFRTALRGGRLVLSNSFGKRVPCFSRRLDAAGNVFKFTVRSSSSASSVRTINWPPQSSPNGLESEEEPSVQTADSRVSGIMFPEREASYYHQVMENLPSYKDTVFTRKDLEDLRCQAPSRICDLTNRQDWSHASIQDIVDAFSKMTAYALDNNLLITDPQFDNICKAISERKFDFDDDEMIKIGKLHTLWYFPESVNDKNYRLMYTTFDEFCCKRYTKEWHSSKNMRSLLQASEVFFWQRVAARSHFLRLMLFQTASKAREPQHMVQLMFYLGLFRTVPSTYKIYELEKRAYRFKNDISLSEMAVVVHSLCRLKSRIQYYPLIEQLFVKSLKAFSKIDDTLLVTISKGSSFTPSELKPLLTIFQRRLTARVDEFNEVSLVHVLWLLSSHCVLEEELTQKVYERVLDSVSSLRMKELSRALVIFTEHKSSTRNLEILSQRTYEELQKPHHLEHLQRKPYIFGAVIHRMLLCGVLPEKLLNLYFSSLKAAETANEALGIDVNLEVFHPDYIGIRLDPKLRENIFQYRFGDSTRKFVKSCGTEGSRSSFNKKALKSGEEVLLEILEGRQDHILKRQLTPSFGYIDVVVRVSRDGCYLPIPNEMIGSQPWKLLRIPPENVKEGDKFIALTFLPHGKEISSKHLLSFYEEKIKILKHLGYSHVLVTLDNWCRLDMNAKRADLMTRIAEALSKV